VNHCNHKATAIHTYGVYEINGVPRDLPMNEIALCDSCGADLWAQIKDAVAAQHMHYAAQSSRLHNPANHQMTSRPRPVDQALGNDNT
jgi:hypothetical protein